MFPHRACRTRRAPFSLGLSTSSHAVATTRPARTAPVFGVTVRPALCGTTLGARGHPFLSLWSQAAGVWKREGAREGNRLEAGVQDMHSSCFQRVFFGGTLGQRIEVMSPSWSLLVGVGAAQGWGPAAQCLGRACMWGGEAGRVGVRLCACPLLGRGSGGGAGEEWAPLLSGQ